jgi:hypothetical protein
MNFFKTPKLFYDEDFEDIKILSKSKNSIKKGECSSAAAIRSVTNIRMGAMGAVIVVVICVTVIVALAIAVVAIVAVAIVVVVKMC